MLASSTVENYLKAIFLATAGTSVDEPTILLPIGQLSAAFGVAPGTATAKVKTLAESGLVRYEPYAGVALTAAGEKLAALVVRRHRLIELFLVRVIGFGWDEVHEEAEQLEHSVSDRLIARIDEMLGQPAVDPHGDPIPDAEGAVRPQDVQTLLTCPLSTMVTVTRVLDQDKSFLRFIERHDLKPGQSITVEARDGAADSVRIRGIAPEPITIGARAASKVLVAEYRPDKSQES
jgi:DtxR family Mn-dependent transcriptional regulator